MDLYFCPTISTPMICTTNRYGHTSQTINSFTSPRPLVSRGIPSTGRPPFDVPYIPLLGSCRRFHTRAVIKLPCRQNSHIPVLLPFLLRLTCAFIMPFVRRLSIPLGTLEDANVAIERPVIQNDGVQILYIVLISHLESTMRPTEFDRRGETESNTAKHVLMR